MRSPIPALLLLTLVSTAQEPDPSAAAPSSGLVLPSGTTATLFASAADHQLTSPTALCIDEQGRILLRLRHPHSPLIERPARGTESGQNPPPLALQGRCVT